MEYLYKVDAMTQRRYILNGWCVTAKNEIDARIKAYKYILEHSQELNYNTSLYLRIELY